MHIKRLILGTTAIFGGCSTLTRVVSNKVSSKMSTARTLTEDEMLSVFDRIEANNLVSQADLEDRGQYLPFCISGRVYGYCKPSFVLKLAKFPCVFDISSEQIEFAASVPATCEGRTAAMATVTQTLREDGTIVGWRDELLPVVERFGEEPALVSRPTPQPHSNSTAM